MAALIPLLVIVALFFVMIVLPQRRQMAARRALIESVQVGDEIITAGGVYGTVRSIADTTMEVEVAPGVVITVARQAVSGRSAAGGGGAPGGSGAAGIGSGDGPPGADDQAD